MTKEMAETIIRRYAYYDRQFDEAEEKDDQYHIDKWLMGMTTIDGILSDTGYKMAKTYDGQFVIVKK